MFPVIVIHVVLTAVIFTLFTARPSGVLLQGVTMLLILLLEVELLMFPAYALIVFAGM